MPVKKKESTPTKKPRKPDTPPKVKKEESQKLRSLKGYVQATGRRKTSTAVARLSLGKRDFVINKKSHPDYFSTLEMQRIIEDPLRKLKVLERFAVIVRVSGGGIHSQAEAIRHAISRALIKYDPDLRKRLKRLGFLTRDPRMKERRKFGLKKARKAPQWSKR
ncbi:30S ribosomal protein S9 [Patescibacteria group bacterium]|nr:30S ribosomal protein S9 [Patescibacteria group bacterium]